MEPVDSGIHQKTEGEEMKPTDEAKRLRDEITEMLMAWEPDTYQKQADEIINKVLDAVVDGLESVHNPCQAVSTPAFLRIRNDAIKSSNKLRP